MHELLSHMAEVRFSKGELIISEGERNSNFYLLKKGIWRAYYLTDGTENSLWFAAPGDTAFSSWGYVDGEVSPVNIESVNESIAYCISKPELEALFSHSIDMANFGRRIFEPDMQRTFCCIAYNGARDDLSLLVEKIIADHNHGIRQTADFQHIALLDA